MKKGPSPVYYLKDGTSLADAVADRGLNKATVYSRLRRGLSPDDAVAVDHFPKGRPPVLRLSDGMALNAAILRAGVSRRCVYHAGASPDAAVAAVADRRDRARVRRESLRTRRPRLPK